MKFKAIIIIFATFISLLRLAHSNTNTYEHEVLYHDVLPGSLHKGGQVDISSIEMTNEKGEEQLKVSLNYAIYPKSYVPVPKEKLSGTEKFILPIEFASESGYIDLANNGPRVLEDIELTFLGFAQIGKYENAYKVKVVDTDDREDGYIIIYYHPHIISTGWIKSEIYLNNVPVVGSYKVISVYREL